MCWVSGSEIPGIWKTFPGSRGSKKHRIPGPQHWNSAAWSPFFEAGRGEDVIEGGGEEPAIVLPADQAVAHEAELHAQAAQYDTRHHRKSRESTRRLLNSIPGIKEKQKSPLYCTRRVQNMIRGITWNREDPMYTRAQYDTQHHGKPRGSVHCSQATEIFTTWWNSPAKRCRKKMPKIFPKMFVKKVF